MVINTSPKSRGDTEVLGAVVPTSITSVQIQTQHAGAPTFPAVLKCPMLTIQESLQAGDTSWCHGPCPPFWAHVHPRATSARPNGKLTSEIRSTVLGSQPLLLQMHFWKEAQTLKYLSVREEACGPECFQPWGKRPEEPVFLYLKNRARASLSTGAGNA